MLLKDFNKMHTFIVVAKERSFSKASKRIGISQPAVTQQIKAIEEYLQVKVIERRKNGITLTKEGEVLLRVVSKLESAIEEGERDLLRIIERKIPLTLAACPVVGNYLLPCCISELRLVMEGQITVDVCRSQEAQEALLARRADVAIYTPDTLNAKIHYVEWIEDELVVVSNQPIGEELEPDDMGRFEWIASDSQSQTRNLVLGSFAHNGMDCSWAQGRDHSVFNNATAIKQAILKGPKDPQRPIIGVISRYAVNDEVERGILFAARIRGCAMSRKLYLACLKERKSEGSLLRAIKFLADKRALAATF